MRGKPRSTVTARGSKRIIPAHAGQTIRQHGVLPCLTDHPRACGANFRHTVIGLHYVGSSPRMRGKQKLTQRVRVICRIIPAHAGQTQCIMRLSTGDADHPRACGANSPMQIPIIIDEHVRFDIIPSSIVLHITRSAGKTFISPNQLTDIKHTR